MRLLRSILIARVALINQGKSTVKDADIQNFLDNRELSITATMDKKEAYEGAEFIIIATPTDYDLKTITSTQVLSRR